MPLNAQQRQTAQYIYSAARARGLAPNRALELVNAAYSESGLNPGAVNKSSGAGGLFQLLSSGYVNKANQMGGVGNPRANLAAILPNYISYWQQHPNAAPGAAARDVERSGKGAGFYSGALGMLSGAVGNVRGLAPPLGAGQTGAAGTAPVTSSGVNPRALLASALIAANQASSRGQPPNYAGLAQLVSAARQPTAPVQSAPSSASPGRSPGEGPPSGGPSLSFLSPLARQFGLQITSTTGGQHVPGSLHYQRRAEDYAGNPQQMAALQRYALSRPGEFSEAFYTGPGAAPYFIKNGKVYPVAQLNPSVRAGHTNHVHLGR